MTEPQLEAIEMAVRELLGSAGYGLYAAPAQARTDDLLVRERAGAALATAADAVGRLRGRYHEEMAPPSTAENPFPPPDVMKQERALALLQQSLSAMGSSVRAQPAPARDAVWARIRDETATLRELLECDLGLVGGAERLRDNVLALTPQTWSSDLSARATADLERLDGILRERARLLQS